MADRDKQEALIERAWQRIASLIESGEARDTASVRSALRALDPDWQDQEVSLVVGLSGFAYGQIMERAREIAASRRSNSPINERVLEELRVADDVEEIIRELFKACESNAVEFQPSLN